MKVSIPPVIEAPSQHEILDLARSLPAFPWQHFVGMRKSSEY